jgi:hypothetical protein
MFVPITKVNEGESNTPCPSTLQWHTPRVEKLSKALKYNKMLFAPNYNSCQNPSESTVIVLTVSNLVLLQGSDHSQSPGSPKISSRSQNIRGAKKQLS